MIQGVDVSPTRPSFASFASVLEEFATFSDFLETKQSSPVVGGWRIGIFSATGRRSAAFVWEGSCHL